MSAKVKIIECPRDAMQGIHEFIPTELKIEYINELLKVGFDTIDFGSFVSPKAIPQLADTTKVIEGLNKDLSDTKLLSIVANSRGAQTACTFNDIDYLGYPFSISETFQIRNTRKTMNESFQLIQEMVEMTDKNNKELIVYLSMGFGNPYGDEWSTEIAEDWCGKIAEAGVNIISLADTVGSATPEVISELYSTLVPSYPHIEIGAHFHSHPDHRQRKIKAAWEAGCRRYDSALRGWGGCPFAEDDLVGNMSTEALISFLESEKVLPELDFGALRESMALSDKVFNRS